MKRVKMLQMVDLHIEKSVGEWLNSHIFSKPPPFHILKEVIVLVGFSAAGQIEIGKNCSGFSFGSCEVI